MSKGGNEHFKTDRKTVRSSKQDLGARGGLVFEEVQPVCTGEENPMKEMKLYN